MDVTLSDLCKEVNELFECKVTENEIEQYPQFQKVISGLCRKTKIKRKELEDKVEQAQQDYEHSRASCLEMSLILSTLKDVIEENKNDALENERVLCKCDLSHKMDGVSASSYLNMALANHQFPSKDDSENLSHFGIRREHFAEHFRPLNQKFVDSFLVPEITKKICQTCQSVLTYYGQECAEESVFSKMVELPALLEKEKRELESDKQSIKRATLAYNTQLEQYFECLMTSLHLLQDQLELVKGNQEFWIMSKEYYSLKCEALIFKLEILMLEILNETYDKDSVLALKNIKKSLDEKESSTEAELIEKTALLKQYESLGPKFTKLAKEFAELSLQIKNEKWTLDKLEKEGEEKEGFLS